MPKIRNHHTDITPGGTGFSRVVRSGNLVFIAGVTARGSDSQGKPFIDQLRVVLDRITRIVAAEGGSPGDITKFTTFVTNVEDWRATGEQNQALMEEYFQGEYPANTLIGTTALAEPGLDVEIEAIAVID
jgi:2-iminobutanoate/2-iminopropanoate deaminase